MKTRYLLPILLALGTTVTSTQATESGLTYDPYANYYSQYYGIGMDTAKAVTKETKAEATPFYDPCANYYNTFYGTNDLLDKNANAQAKDLENYPDMSNPINFYKW